MTEKDPSVPLTQDELAKKKRTEGFEKKFNFSEIVAPVFDLMKSFGFSEEKLSEIKDTPMIKVLFESAGSNGETDAKTVTSVATKIIVDTLKNQNDPFARGMLPMVELIQNSVRDGGDREWMFSIGENPTNFISDMISDPTQAPRITFATTKLQQGDRGPYEELLGDPKIFPMLMKNLAAAGRAVELRQLHEEYRVPITWKIVEMAAQNKKYTVLGYIYSLPPEDVEKSIATVSWSRIEGLYDDVLLRYWHLRRTPNRYRDIVLQPNLKRIFERFDANFTLTLSWLFGKDESKYYVAYL